MISRFCEEFANLGEPHWDRVHDVRREPELGDVDGSRPIITSVTERIEDGQNSKRTGVDTVAIVEKDFSGSIIDSGPSVTEQHVDVDEIETVSKPTSLLDGEEFVISAQNLYSTNKSRKETFYTHIAKILHEFGPLPVAEIYVKLFARIGPQLNKNWKNSVRHALSSKTSFFAKCSKCRRSSSVSSSKAQSRRRRRRNRNRLVVCQQKRLPNDGTETHQQPIGRGRAWVLVCDYKKLMHNQPRHAARGRRVISEQALARMKKIQEYNDIISTFYNYYFVNGLQRAAVTKYYNRETKQLVDNKIKQPDDVSVI